MIGLFKIFDAHVHFYSNSFFKFLIKQKPNRADINTELRNLAAKGHIEIPGEDPEQLAKRWIDIMDKWKLERSMLFGSIPGDEDSVVKAVQAFPTRFSGIFTIDPNSNVLMENATKRMKEDKFKGILLYPSLYHISVNDEWLYPLYNLIQECKGIIFVHFGKLLMRPRDFAGIPLMTNEEFSNPKDLIPFTLTPPDLTHGSTNIQINWICAACFRNSWISFRQIGYCSDRIPDSCPADTATTSWTIN